MNLAQFGIRVVTGLVVILLAACGGGGGGGGDGGNVYLVADPTDVKQVATGSYVMLDASDSIEKSGNEIYYNWIIVNTPSGSAASLEESEKNTVNPNFVPDVDGTYEFELEISTDNNGKKVTSKQTIEVVASSGNVKPMAETGPNIEARANSSVQLNASLSYDANGDGLNYQWSIVNFPPGSNPILSSETEEEPNLDVDLSGDYEIELIVNDGEKSSEPKRLTVTVVESNVRPIAVAGYDIYAQVNDSVKLDGKLSRDAENDTLTYSWFFASKPSLSTASLSNANSVNPSFVPDVEGAYVVSLRVNDGTQRADNNIKRTSDIDNVLIVVTKGDNAPVAIAGLDQNVETNVNVKLNGISSYDLDGDALTYQWTVFQSPEGSSIILNDADKVRSDFTPDQSGQYILNLIVSDGTSDSEADVVIITVTAPNKKPVSNPGVYETVAINTEVQLDGSLSSDEDGDNLTFFWSLNQKPGDSAAQLSATDIENPTLTPDVVGDYEISLVVNDGEADSEAVVFTITAFVPNQKPIANPGVYETVSINTEVQLDGSLSSDADGDSLTFLWSLNQKPGTSSTQISTTDIVDPTFTPDVAGDYKISLVVNDGLENSEAVLFTITAFVPNQKPIANAGQDQNDISLGTSVTLNGSESTDNDGDQITYLWSFVSGPEDITSLITDITAVAPGFTPVLAGIYELSLVVNDGKENSEVNNVVITVVNNVSINTPPVVEIVSPANKSEFTSAVMIEFIGNATDVEDGDLSGEALVWTSNIDGVLETSGNTVTQVLSDGEHTVTLTATDNNNEASSTSIKVCVGDSCNIVMTENYENGWSFWSASNGVWQIGTPTTGPGACSSGVQCAGTNLDGNYGVDTDSSLISKKFQMPALEQGEELHIRFNNWFSYLGGDAGYVQIQEYDTESKAYSDWQNVGSSIIHTSGWSIKDVDITSYAGKVIRFGFYHTASRPCCGSDNYESHGWFIDDVSIEITVPEFKNGDFESGWLQWGAERGIWQIDSSTCYSGDQCAGTNLGGNYGVDTDSRLVSATTVLPALIDSEELHLRFFNWFSYIGGDAGYVQIQEWNAETDSFDDWVSIGASIVDTSGWSLKDIDISQYAGKKVRIAFYHTASRPCCGSDNYESSGWYLDDITIDVVTPGVENNNFELGWEQWGADRGVWQIGAPSAGPGGCAEGENCAGTHLSSNYGVNTDSRLIGPTMTLPAVNGLEELHVRFQHWFSYIGGDAGYFQIQVWDDTAKQFSDWQTLGVAVTNSSNWSLRDEDISIHAGSMVRFAFYHTASRPCCGSDNYESSGWFIDELELVVF